MEGTGFHIPPTSRVRLRNSVDPAVYGDFACVGNEGWIKDQRQDRFGLPEVLIEWDTNHWAYNGVPDCWTFEEHFELVEDTMDRQEHARQAALEFANTMASIFADQGNGQAEQAEQVPDLASRFQQAGRLWAPQSEPKDPYQEATEAAMHRLSNAEGFVVIGVERRNDGLLEPFAIGESKTPKAEIAVQAHMTGVSARANQELALQVLSQATQGE